MVRFAYDFRYPPRDISLVYRDKIKRPGKGRFDRRGIPRVMSKEPWSGSRWIKNLAVVAGVERPLKYAPHDSSRVVTAVGPLIIFKRRINRLAETLTLSLSLSPPLWAKPSGHPRINNKCLFSFRAALKSHENKRSPRQRLARRG